MEISKSTPYVRYRENISSTLHKGTIHIESEYLDRERKTTIESIEGQTWQNMVNGENKEEEILPRLGLKIEGNEDVFDTVEQHMPIDTIVGDIEPVANEDGTYTYEISTMEGSYAKTLDGENNFSLTSDGLVGDIYIKYNAQGEEVNGNIVMNGQSNHTIENSNNGEIKSAILKGQTLVNLIKLKSCASFISYNNGTAIFTNPTGSGSLSFSVMFKPSTKYIFRANFKCDSDWINTIRMDLFPDTYEEFKGFTPTPTPTNYYFTFTTPSDISTLSSFRIYVSTGGSGIATVSDIMILEYQEGMENWDIPFFEGMQSVKMPVLTTTGKNLLDPNYH